MNQKKIVHFSLISTGVFTFLFGLAHNLVPIWRDVELKDIGTWWLFEVTGTSIMFAGILSIYAATGLNKKEQMALPLGILSGIFLTICGISANIMMGRASQLTVLGLLSLTLPVICKILEKRN